MKALSTPLLSPRGLTAVGSAIGYGVGHEAVRSQGDALRAYHGDAEYDSKYAKGIGMMHAGVTIGAMYGGASAIFGRSIGARKGGSTAAGIKRYASSGFMPLGTAGAANLVGRGARGIAGGAKAAWSSKTMTGLLSAPKNFRNARQINRNALRPRQRDLADLRSPLRAGTRRRPAPGRNQRRQEIRDQLRARGAAKGGTLQERYAAEQARLQPGIDTAQGKYDAARQTFGGGAYHQLVNAPANIAGAIAGSGRAMARGARGTKDFLALGVQGWAEAGAHVARGVGAGARRGALGGAIAGQMASPILRKLGAEGMIASSMSSGAGFFGGGLLGGAVAPAAMAVRGAGKGLAAGGRGLVAGGVGAYKGAAGMMPNFGNMQMPEIPWSKMDPANWTKGQMFAGGLGMVAAGGIAGNAYSRGSYHFPIMEAGNVTLAPSTAQRMNFSTVGLTQALHDNRRQTP